MSFPRPTTLCLSPKHPPCGFSVFCVFFSLISWTNGSYLLVQGRHSCPSMAEGHSSPHFAQPPPPSPLRKSSIRGRCGFAEPQFPSQTDVPCCSRSIFFPPGVFVFFSFKRPRSTLQLLCVLHYLLALPFFPLKLFTFSSFLIRGGRGSMLRHSDLFTFYIGSTIDPSDHTVTFFFFPPLVLDFFPPHLLSFSAFRGFSNQKTPGPQRFA